MASKFRFLLTSFLLSSLLFTTVSVNNNNNNNPNAVIVPVSKDNQTGLHVITVQKRTPLKQIPLLFDLNGKFLSVNCDRHYSSSTYRTPFCHSTQCARAGAHSCNKCYSKSAKPGCHNNTCAVVATNPLTQRNVAAELAEDVLAVQSTTTGSNPGRLVYARKFLFACAPSHFLQGPLPKNVQGIAGFADDPVSLPVQLSSQFGFPPKFATCLSSRNDQKGVIFIGNTSYKIHPQIDFSGSIKYTPISVGSKGQYFVMVKSISINDVQIRFNTSLISRTRSFGGTMISTTSPYTVMEHSIFKPFSEVFTKEITRMGANQVGAIPPFGACFQNLRELPKVGIGAPMINFVMQNSDVTWTFFGPNSVVEVRPAIWCLAFVDGGTKPRNAPVVVGAYQMQDRVVEFDLGKSRLGFGNALHFSRVSCGQFNFSTSAKP